MESYWLHFFYVPNKSLIPNEHWWKNLHLLIFLTWLRRILSINVHSRIFEVWTIISSKGSSYSYQIVTSLTSVFNVPKKYPLVWQQRVVAVGGGFLCVTKIQKSDDNIFTITLNLESVKNLKLMLKGRSGASILSFEVLYSHSGRRPML